MGDSDTELDGFFSQKIKESELKEGDHIYTWRKRIYSHHGIYIGGGMLIHFVNKPKNESVQFSVASSVSSMKKTGPCLSSQCESKIDTSAGGAVKRTCVNCFKKKGSLYLFKYEASESFIYWKRRGGTCTTAKSDPPEEVIHRANYLYQNGYVKYDLMDNNCEDFALYCKTGLWSNNTNYKGRSSQANMVHPTEEDEGQSRNFLLRIVTAIPRSHKKRVNKDLGVRQDVVKVRVENLSSFSHSLGF